MENVENTSPETEEILESYGHILFCVNTHQAVLIDSKIDTKCLNDAG